MYLHSVAPRELIQADFEVLKSYERLETTREIEEILFIQSLEGRAHNGAGIFNKKTYVNTTIDDIVRALDLDGDKIKARRQALIDDINQFADEVMSGVKREKLTNHAGEPFLGIPYFLDWKVNSRDVLRGLYMGGLRDNPDIRKETERLFKINIGGGRCYIISVKKMLEMNLDGERLAHDSHEDRIAEYEAVGLIEAHEGFLDIKSQRYFYIRHRVGPGQSDDAALVLAGILYNRDVALGVFLSDAIDTLEKFVPFYKDQDGGLSFRIGRGFKDLNLSMDDVYEFTALCAIPEIEEDLVPDSSLRYLLSIDQRSQTCAFKTHLDFIAGKPIVPLPVSFKRILSTQFYEYINRRLLNVKKLEKFAMPNINVKDLDKPLSDFLAKDYAILSKDATIAEAVRKFKETKCSVLIIQDKNNKVIGVLSPADLMRYVDGEKEDARTAT